MSFEAPALPWREDPTDPSGRWLKPEYSHEQQQILSIGKYGGVVSSTITDAAKSGTLVPFVGAGTSCIPPTGKCFSQLVFVYHCHYFSILRSVTLILLYNFRHLLLFFLPFIPG